MNWCHREFGTSLIVQRWNHHNSRQLAWNVIVKCSTSLWGTCFPEVPCTDATSALRPLINKAMFTLWVKLGFTIEMAGNLKRIWSSWKSFGFNPSKVFPFLFKRSCDLNVLGHHNLLSFSIDVNMKGVMAKQGRTGTLFKKASILTKTVKLRI